MGESKILKFWGLPPPRFRTRVNLWIKEFREQEFMSIMDSKGIQGAEQTKSDVERSNWLKIHKTVLITGAQNTLTWDSNLGRGTPPPGGLNFGLPTTNPKNQFSVIFTLFLPDSQVFCPFQIWGHSFKFRLCFHYRYEVSLSTFVTFLGCRIKMAKFVGQESWQKVTSCKSWKVVTWHVFKKMLQNTNLQWVSAQKAAVKTLTIGKLDSNRHQIAFTLRRLEEEVRVWATLCALRVPEGN